MKIKKFNTAHYLDGRLEQMFKFQKGTHNETNCIQISVHIQLDDVEYKDFINGFKVNESECIKELLSCLDLSPLNAIPIENLDLSVSAYNALKANKINTLYELTNKSQKQILTFNNIGVKALENIKQALSAYSLTLKQ
jgi:DNA-directed RNA polymerase alpha subunit